MGLLDSFEDDNSAALDDLVRRPPKAQPFIKKGGRSPPNPSISPRGDQLPRA